MMRSIVITSLACMTAGQYGPDPPGTPADFMCGWRELTYEYANKVRPDAAALTYDALQLSEYCNGTVRPDPSSLPVVFPPKESIVGSAVYVDPVNGNDGNSGSIDSPFKTIQKGIERKVANVVLREGTFFEDTPINLTPEHNGMTITNYPGEEVWISGGRKLTGLKWEKSTMKGFNVWEADLSSMMSDDAEVTELRVNGSRAWQARFPNANPEQQFWPIGYLTTDVGQWKEPKVKPAPNTATLVNVTSPNREWDIYFSTYMGGINGTCAVYDVPFSFFCQNDSAMGITSGCGACFTYYLPGDLNTSNSLPARYPSLEKAGTKNKAYLSAWRLHHWANWVFEIDQYHPNGTTDMILGYGGFQGARGGPGSDYYVSNILEELDVVGEFYYDIDAKRLYLSSNTTEGTPPAADTEFIAVVHNTLMTVTSPSKANPVKDVTIRGVGFRDTTSTMLQPHSVPSGGDWSLERMGALFLENTENVTITQSKFWKLGGNAVMISKSNLHTNVNHNEFAWLGATAVAAWGWTDEITDNGIHGYDGTTQDFPRYTQIISNLFREIGMWEKQSSGYFQAKTAQSTVRHNLVFNLARAGFNLNDGFGGGDVIYENVLFNTCRESSDHGPINSWDRQPFLTTVRTGEPSMQMQWRHVMRNIVIANYGGIKEVDTDDGSLFYRIHDNFMAYGWVQKFKCGAIESFNNVKAFVDTGGKFGPTCTSDPARYYPNLWHDDIMSILPYTGDFVYRLCWGTADGQDNDKTQVYNNSLYLQPGTEAVITCNGVNVTLTKFQEEGNDPQTTQIQEIPSSAQTIAWAKERLGSF